MTSRKKSTASPRLPDRGAAADAAMARAAQKAAARLNAADGTQAMARKLAPDDVATWVEDQACAMGVGRESVWRALVAIAKDAEWRDENALILAVEAEHWKPAAVERKEEVAPGAEERLEALLAATERPDTHLLTLTLPASTIALGQAGGLIREVLARAKDEKVAALREVADILERDWAQLGTRTLILKTIRDRAITLEAKLSKRGKL